jgi:hypothetical protein
MAGLAKAPHDPGRFPTILVTTESRSVRRWEVGSMDTDTSVLIGSVRDRS